MATPHLPQEIVEEIIDKLAGDAKTLSSCSLVSTAWVDRTRHHLFAHVKLSSLSEFQFWSSTSLGRSSCHVRSLDLAQDDEKKWITPDGLATILNDFVSFYNVESLSLTGLDLTPFDEDSLTRFFGHFSKHLTSFTIKRSMASPDALLFFVCLFPGIDNLKLDNLDIVKDTTTFRKPVITPRFRGKLALLNIKLDGTPLTAPFVDPPIPMAFTGVCVENCRFESPKSLKDLFDACQETVKAVKVSRIYLDDTSQMPLIDLSPFKSLEEVGLSLVYLRRPSHWVESILQTVSSTRVRKITFDTDFSSVATDIDSGINLRSWASLDAMFLAMASKLDGADEKFEVVFNALDPITYEEFGPVEPGRFLETCRTKATVRFMKQLKGG